MANGTKPPAALRLTAAPEEAAPETLPEEVTEAPSMEGGTITIAGADREAFKAMLGHECKVGDKYTVELTATEVSPNAITFSLDNVESEYEEEELPESEVSAEAPAAAPGAKSPAMTYA